eukprot:916119-Pelagomonas_calceolata.AAC.4
MVCNATRSLAIRVRSSAYNMCVTSSHRPEAVHRRRRRRRRKKKKTEKKQDTAMSKNESKDKSVGMRDEDQVSWLKPLAEDIFPSQSARNLPTLVCVLSKVGVDLM